MANNIGSQIIGELGEIGKQVGNEVANIPKDIAGKAMESMGATSGKPGQKSPMVSTSPTGEKSAWETIDSEKDKKVKRSIARKALEELANREIKRKEPSIWERLQQEQEQKKNQLLQQKAAASQQLQPGASKRPRGDLYGAKAKKTTTENRNVRQD
jgi:hypothetical protein